MRISDWSSDVCSSDLPTQQSWLSNEHVTPSPRQAGRRLTLHGPNVLPESRLNGKQWPLQMPPPRLPQRRQLPPRRSPARKSNRLLQPTQLPAHHHKPPQASKSVGGTAIDGLTQTLSRSHHFARA